MSVATDDRNEAVTEGGQVTGRADLLDADQISAELGVNVKTIRRWMTDGDLRNLKLGNRRVTRRSWLEQFLDDRASQ
jgi:Helix-turn-helix domain